MARTSVTTAAERIVADHAALVLPALTERDARLAALPGKADAVIGMRRSGKTWLVLQTLAELERGGLARGHSLYANLEDERLAGVGLEVFAELLDAAYRREPSAATAPFWLLLDEVQVVPGWEAFVRRMLDTRRVRVVVTGSSARLLSRELATSLRGRSLATEVLPFSFREALRHAHIGIPDKLPPPPRARAELERALSGYLTTGGFPEIQELAQPLRRRVLQEYVDVTLLRDVVERHRATNVVALRRLVSHLLRSPSCKLSVHKIYLDLRSQGVAVGKGHLHEYLAHLEDACFAFTVPVDSDSERRRAVVPRKSYLVDPGLAALAAVDPLAQLRGHLLENVVYLELRRRGARLSYHVAASGAEVDFVARHDDGETELVQVCAEPDAADTLARELRGLAAAAPAFPKARLVIVTLTREGTLELSRRRVHLVPAWRFLLER
ncbi:MAG: ATP-binding protein [Myxococcales bacterium]|nr:ATP-binding protein [Myxococcales bacterium]